MRWLGALARGIGWLLTPLVAWAASLYGAWLALAGQARFSSPRTALFTAFGFAVVSGTLIMLVWTQLLRRSPRLRKSLHVTTEGLPEIEEPPAAPPPTEPGASP